MELDTRMLASIGHKRKVSDEVILENSLTVPQSVIDLSDHRVIPNIYTYKYICL